MSPSCIHCLDYTLLQMYDNRVKKHDQDAGVLFQKYKHQLGSIFGYHNNAIHGNKPVNINDAIQC